MPSKVHILRFFRDTEALLREVAERKTDDIISDLVQLADQIALQETALKHELIAEGFMYSDSRHPNSRPEARIGTEPDLGQGR